WRRDGARGLDDRAVLHARRARRLAGTAIQTGKDVLPKVEIRWIDFALVDLTDLIDPPAGRIGLMSEHAVRRAVVEAQPAVDALLEQLLVEELVQLELRCRQRTDRD